MKKYVPNMLSLSRVIFTASLLFFTENTLRTKIIFTVLYFLIALTDTLDGQLARRFQVQSELGAKLDSLGDLAFFIVGFICVMFLMKLEAVDWLKCLVTIAIATASVAFNFILIRVRFKQWSMMHTYFGKFWGVLLYLFVPLCMWMGEINFWVVLVCASIVFLSEIEIAYICFTSDSYDPDHRGVLVEKYWPK